MGGLEVDLVKFGVLGNEVLEVGDDGVVLVALGVVGRDRGELGGGVEAGDAATVAGGGIGLRAARAGIGLAAGASALVEDRSVDFGDDEVLGPEEVEGRGGGGAEGEGVELGLRECGDVYVG